MPDWDTVYAEKSVENATPADVLIMHDQLLNAQILSGQALALDYACGLGGNAVSLAKKGFKVEAWDLSDMAINKINKFVKKQVLDVSAEVHDLEVDAPKIKNKFNVIVVSYFLHRESLRSLYDLLKTDGLLFYQTFSGLQVNGEGPSNKNFRLTKNELLNVYSDMQLLFYQEDDVCVDVGGSPGLTYFVARK